MRKIGIDQGLAINVAVVTKKVAVGGEKAQKKRKGRKKPGLGKIRIIREKNKKKREKRTPR